MKISEIEMLFNTDFSDPGSVKSGEYLSEHVLSHANYILNYRHERHGLIEVMKNWLEERRLPQTLLALEVASTYQLNELLPTMHEIREEVIVGTIFMKFYVTYFDGAIKSLEDSVANNFQPNNKP
jgi:hypothetical protein